MTQQYRNANRKSIVALFAMFLVCLLSLMYAFVKKSEVDKQRELVDQQAQIARQNQEIAERFAIEVKELRIKYDEVSKVVAEKDSIINQLKSKK